jgi:hypothetical protein
MSLLTRQFTGLNACRFEFTRDRIITLPSRRLYCLKETQWILGPAPATLYSYRSPSHFLGLKSLIDSDMCYFGGVEY